MVGSSQDRKALASLVRFMVLSEDNRTIKSGCSFTVACITKHLPDSRIYPVLDISIDPFPFTNQNIGITIFEYLITHKHYIVRSCTEFTDQRIMYSRSDKAGKVFCCRRIPLIQACHIIKKPYETCQDCEPCDSFFLKMLLSHQDNDEPKPPPRGFQKTSKPIATFVGETVPSRFLNASASP